VLYERVLPFTGVLGFWISWYVVFLILYSVMARLQWDRLDARNRLAAVAFATAGVVAFIIVVEQVGYTLLRGSSAVGHVNFWTQSQEAVGPSSPMSVGGVLNSIVGSGEELGLSTVMSVPLGITAALFLSEIGGGLARATRTIVEAMTALPDLVSGLFIYIVLVLSIGYQQCGFCASVAIAITMISRPRSALAGTRGGYSAPGAALHAAVFWTHEKGSWIRFRLRQWRRCADIIGRETYENSKM